VYVIVADFGDKFTVIKQFLVKINQIKLPNFVNCICNNRRNAWKHDTAASSSSGTTFNSFKTF